MSFLRRVFILLSLVVCISGCAATVAIPSIDNLKPVDVKIAPGNVDFFSGLFLADDKQGNKVRYAIQYIAPTNLRVELFPTTSFYQLGLLIINNGQYIFRSGPDNRNESGAFSADVLQQAIGLQFTQSQLVSAILQKIPDDISSYKTYADDRGQTFVFDDSNSFIGIFDSNQLIPKEFYYFNDGDVVAKLVFKQPLPECKSEILVPQYDANFSIDCVMFKTDKRPADSRFELH